MLIYLDTNVFYNDWLLGQANLKYLFHFIANENSKLIISKVVCEEAENIQKREQNSSLEKLKREIKIIKKLTSIDVSSNSLSEIDNFKYDFLSIIKEKCEELEIIDYESVNHSEVVNKALGLKKPFSVGEKGYRDTLIWLSLLEYIKKTNYKGEVAFITNNTSDFFCKINKEIKLHLDLIEDIKKHRNDIKITPYESLFSFINKNIDEDKHIVNHERIVVDVAYILEEEGEKYFYDISRKKLNSILYISDYHEFLIDNLLSIGVKIMEGLEDEYLEKSKKIDKDIAFLTLSYNLRRVILTIEIPKDEYEKNKNIIDKTSFNNESTEDSVFFEILIRPYFDISFIYEIASGDYNSTSINCIKIK